MRRIFLITGSILILTACSPSSDGGGSSPEGDGEARSPSSEDARLVLQSWFDENPQCTPFFPVPYDVAVESEYNRKQAQVFVDAGLLRQEGEVAVADPNSGSGVRRVVRYSATPEGQKQVRPGTGALANTPAVICYGTRDVKDVKVGQIDTMGDRVSVAFSYRLNDVPAWARSAPVAAFYPTFQQWLDRTEEEHEDLIWKDGKWSLEGPPSSGMFDLRQLSH